MNQLPQTLLNTDVSRAGFEKSILAHYMVQSEDSKKLVFIIIFIIIFFSLRQCFSVALVNVLELAL